MSTRVVHLVEQGGRGGVFQHTVALARLLRERGEIVRLHTASDPELDASAPGIELCTCMEWFRGYEGPSRRLLIASRYLVRTLPHLLASVRRDDIVHVQGTWQPQLATLTLATLRLRGRVVFSPHNTFARSGSRLDAWFLRRDVELADATIVFSEFDERAVAAMGRTAVRSPLVQMIPEPLTPTDWRARWDPRGRRVVLLAGQLRHDKRFDRVVEAIACMPERPLLAVVGEDKGAAPAWRALTESSGVETHWTVGFLPLEEFTAAIRAADVVVCPYERASQSGVLSIASQLGVPTVATAVGGLGELADEAVTEPSPHRLAEAIGRALEGLDRIGGTRPDPWEPTWNAHSRAYGLVADEGAR